MNRTAPPLSALLSEQFFRFTTWARTEQAYRSFVGRYRWNERASSYSTPHESTHSLARFLEILYDGPAGLKLRKRVTMPDGTDIAWRHDVSYDGTPADDGAVTWKLARLTPDSIGNEWVMNDGSCRGYEIHRMAGDRITNSGVQIDIEGKEHPYVEVWERVKDWQCDAAG